jgi:dihydrolipoamide dehydrogenase
MEQKELVIIGGGPAGYTAAIRAAQLGGKVTLIEKDILGGTCVNRGCIPTKCLLHSANIHRQIKRANLFGVLVGNPTFDFPAVSRRKKRVVKQLVDDVEFLMRKNNISVIRGVGTILGHGKVRLVSMSEERVIQADSIIIATGSESATIAIEGITGEGVLNSSQALSLEQPPASMIVIGGGVVGLEFAQVFHRMNTKVTVIEIMPQILPGEDYEIAQILCEMLKAEGISILTEAKVKMIKSDKSGRKVVFFNTKDGEKQVVVDKILLAAGRRPLVEGLGLEKLGVALNNGAIIVNKKTETSVKDIYAVGDVVGGHMLAHVAMVEGRCAAQNAMGAGTEMDYRAIPRCIYTDPELAAVGLTEMQAREKYDNVKIGKFTFRANGKALILDETEGMVKLIADARYGQLLGVEILGPHATELIAEAVLGIQMEATVDDFASTIHAHPTLSETVMGAAIDFTGGAMRSSSHV